MRWDDIYDTSIVEESYINLDLNGCLPLAERATALAALAALAALLVVLTVLTVGLAILTVITTTGTTCGWWGCRRYWHRTGVVVLVRNLVLIRLLGIRVRWSLEAWHNQVLCVPLGVEHGGWLLLGCQEHAWHREGRHTTTVLAGATLLAATATSHLVAILTNKLGEFRK